MFDMFCLFLVALLGLVVLACLFLCCVFLCGVVGVLVLCVL